MTGKTLQILYYITTLCYFLPVVQYHFPSPCLNVKKQNQAYFKLTPAEVQGDIAEQCRSITIFPTPLSQFSLLQFLALSWSSK